MRRVSVVGSSGSGKSTLARSLAEGLGVPHIELDALFHGPGWTAAEPVVFRERVLDLLNGSAEGWVVDGNYSVVRELVWERADTVLHLDLPRWRVMKRLVPRTLRRLVTREALWNGNREPWSNLWSLNPEKNVIVWSWVNHGRYRRRYRAAGAAPRWGHLTVVHLGSPDEIESFIERL